MAKKKCCGCKKTKALELFPPDKRTKDGRQGRCNKCCAERTKKYLNTESGKKKQKEWLILHQKEITEKQRIDRRNNPEKYKEITKRYKENHYDDFIKIQQEYRLTPRGSANGLFHQAKRRSKKKNLECDITREWIETKIENGFCELTDIPFDLSANRNPGHFRPFSPSVDKIDNKGGYTKDNCRIVLSAINVALNEWGEEQFTKIVLAYLNKRGFKLCPRSA